MLEFSFALRLVSDATAIPGNTAASAAASDPWYRFNRPWPYVVRLALSSLSSLQYLAVCYLCARDPLPGLRLQRIEAHLFGECAQELPLLVDALPLSLRYHFLARRCKTS